MLVCKSGLVLLLLSSLSSVAVGQNVDGGRSDLPGMRQDMFDQVQKQKKMGGNIPRGKIPDCPKSDKMSPFVGLAFAEGEMYVKIHGTPEEKCQKLLTVNGANYTELTNFSRTCGPPGEVKRRIAEELSAMFFQGGFDWVKHENETVEIVTEEGTFQVEVSEAKYAQLEECWRKGCECEQAKNPIMRVILCSIGVIAFFGLFADAFKYGLEKIRGKKPSKHVMSKKGTRVTEGKVSHNRHCDMCGVRGTNYSDGANYDLCKKCYKEAKKKAKAEWAKWLEDHPEDRKTGKDKDDDDEDEKKKAESGDDKADAATSEAESGTEAAASSECNKSEASAASDEKPE